MYLFWMPVFFDFETLIARKGRPRTFTRWFEIGAVCIKSARVLSMLVDPVSEWEVTDARSLVTAIYESGMNPRPSIRFWGRTLKRKGHPYFLERYRYHFFRRTEIDSLPFLESAVDFAYAHSLSDMLIKGRSAKNTDVDDVFALHKPFTALHELRELIYDEGDNTLVAHNGKSFDFHVLRGTDARVTRCREILKFHEVKMVDSIPVFRKAVPGHKTYSQPLLYSTIFGEQYNAHIAIDDARALRRIWKHAVKGKSTSAPSRVPSRASVSPSRAPSRASVSPLSLPPPAAKVRPSRPIIIMQRSPRSKKEHVTQIPGIGPATARALANLKIRKISELHALWQERKKEGRTLKGVVRFWRKVEKYLAEWEPV